MWTYLLVFNPENYDDDSVRLFLDNHEHIVNWMTPFANAYFFASPLYATALTHSFVEHLGTGRFFIIDTNVDRNGRLPKAAWNLMVNPGPP